MLHITIIKFAATNVAISSFLDKQLDGMKVVASSSPSGHKYSTSCTKHYLKFRRGETKRISCQANTFGKYVRISVPGNRTTLSLCEVEVYGSKGKRVSQLAKSKPTEQRFCTP